MLAMCLKDHSKFRILHCDVQVDSAAKDLPQLYAHYQQTTFYRQLNVSLEDQNWALDCIHSRSVSVPQLISRPQPFTLANSLRHICWAEAQCVSFLEIWLLRISADGQTQGLQRMQVRLQIHSFVHS